MVDAPLTVVPPPLEKLLAFSIRDVQQLQDHRLCLLPTALPIRYSNFWLSHSGNPSAAAGNAASALAALALLKKKQGESIVTYITRITSVPTAWILAAYAFGMRNFTVNRPSNTKGRLWFSCDDSITLADCCEAAHFEDEDFVLLDYSIGIRLARELCAMCCMKPHISCISVEDSIIPHLYFHPASSIPLQVTA
jgi:hypothetical protein